MEYVNYKTYQEKDFMHWQNTEVSVIFQQEDISLSVFSRVAIFFNA
jgi:hypothetical protein